jgi:hypothetical protein
VSFTTPVRFIMTATVMNDNNTWWMCKEAYIIELLEHIGGSLPAVQVWTINATCPNLRWNLPTNTLIEKIKFFANMVEFFINHPEYEDYDSSAPTKNHSSFFATQGQLVCQYLDETKDIGVFIPLTLSPYPVQEDLEKLCAHLAVASFKLASNKKP